MCVTVWLFYTVQEETSHCVKLKNKEYKDKRINSIYTSKSVTALFIGVIQVSEKILKLSPSCFLGPGDVEK